MIFAFYLEKDLLRVKLILVKLRRTRSALVGVESFDAGVRSVASLQFSRYANYSGIVVIFLPDGQLLSVIGFPVSVRW